MGDDVYPAASESDSTSTAITAEEKAPDPPIASEYLMVTAPSSSSYIAHFSIPESLRPAFRDVLCNPPDPDLKIKKKSVRFTKSVRRIRQDDLFHLKEQVFTMTQSLEDKDSILDEVRAERKSLQSELSRYIAMVKQVQKDLELVKKTL
ncbi:hypothetical protein BGZ74_000755, partial [Mortierella antarctica]